MAEKFWMVLIDGTRSTSYKHTTFDSARIEAERLLKLCEPDRGATILEAVEYGRIKNPPFEWTPTINGVYFGDEIDQNLPF